MSKRVRRREGRGERRGTYSLGITILSLRWNLLRTTLLLHRLQPRWIQRDRHRDRESDREGGNRGMRANQRGFGAESRGTRGGDGRNEDLSIVCFDQYSSNDAETGYER